MPRVVQGIPENHEAPCNICERGWPYHEEACSYAVAAGEAQRAREFLRWLVSLDDPEDVLGREERRTVTLTKIIDRAREVLNAI